MLTLKADGPSFMHPSITLDGVLRTAVDKAELIIEVGKLDILRVTYSGGPVIEYEVNALSLDLTADEVCKCTQCDKHKAS